MIRDDPTKEEDGQAGHEIYSNQGRAFLQMSVEAMLLKLSAWINSHSENYQVLQGVKPTTQTSISVHLNN